MLKRTHVRQFLALVEAGSFTRAAERLAITQPTLSAGIAELERLVGSPLFLRERRAVRLTEAGNRLLPSARAIEREFRSAESAARGAVAPAQPLRLGLISSLSASLVTAIGARCGAAHPLALTEGSDIDLRRRLAEHQIDAALTLLRAGESAPVLIEEDYAMILPAQHRLAGRATLDPEELADEVMIARRSCEILGETSRYFTTHGIRPRFLLRSHNDERCLALVAAGCGVTTGPRSLAVPRTVAVPLRGYDFVRRIGIVSAPGLAESRFRPVAEALRDAVADAARCNTDPA